MKNILIVISSVFILSLLSQVTLEIPSLNETTIPVTLQSLIVLVIAGILKPSNSILVIIIYVLLGILGLPVFANGNSGIEVILGNTGGYIIGFILSTILISNLVVLKKPSSFFHFSFLMLIGTVIIIICGVIQLSYLKGFQIAIQYGLIPILPGAIIKIFLGALILKLYNSYLSNN